MIDLDAVFDAVISSDKCVWDENAIRNFVFRVNSITGASGDRDILAGEAWVVFTKRETICLASCCMPLVFVICAYAERLKCVCRDFGVLLIPVDSFDAPIARVGQGRLIAALAGPDALGEETRAVISINDVWFMTV